MARLRGKPLTPFWRRVAVCPSFSAATYRHQRALGMSRADAAAYTARVAWSYLRTGGLRTLHTRHYINIPVKRPEANGKGAKR